MSTSPCETVVFLCENSNGKKIIKSTKFYLFKLMIVKRCSYNKHFIAKADGKVCGHYFNNLTILLFHFHARAEAENH